MQCENIRIIKVRTFNVFLTLFTTLVLLSAGSSWCTWLTRTRLNTRVRYVTNSFLSLNLTPSRLFTVREKQRKSCTLTGTSVGFTYATNQVGWNVAQEQLSRRKKQCVGLRWLFLILTCYWPAPEIRDIDVHALFYVTNVEGERNTYSHIFFLSCKWFNSSAANIKTNMNITLKEFIQKAWHCFYTVFVRLCTFGI